MNETTENLAVIIVKEAKGKCDKCKQILLKIVPIWNIEMYSQASMH